MKAGFLQFSPSFGEKQKNFDQVEHLLCDITADIIVLPELFNTGYTFLNKNELTKLAEPIDGETSNFIQQLAKKKNCSIVYGFAEKYNDLFFNSMSFMSPADIVQTYRKSHLFFEERNFFQPGDTGFKVFEHNGVKIGMLICWDWIYPEAMRTLALKDAQIILHSANLVTPYCPDAMITRAIENRVFVITADRIGEEKRNGKKFHFIGKSQIVAPNGEVLVRVGEETCVKVVEIDPGLALDKKITEHNDLFTERREELYFK